MKIQIEIKKEDIEAYLKLVDSPDKITNKFVLDTLDKTDILNISDKTINMVTDRNEKTPLIIQGLAIVQILLNNKEQYINLITCKNK